MDSMRDPLSEARGVVYGALLGILAWSIIGVAVWAVRS